MRKILLSLLLGISAFTATTIQGQNKTEASTNERVVTCEVIQKNNNISIFPNYNYLKGTDYWKHILYNTDGTKKTFSEVNDAISCLGCYGWKNTRQYTISKDNSIHFIMQKQCSPMELNGSSTTKQWLEIISGKKQK